MTKPDLDSAYALKTPEDSQKLYGEWAESYEETFAQATGYRLPLAVADAFVARGGTGPVLDIGAGTGLVGEELSKRGVCLIDGTDISPQMLAEAALKDCYENLFEGDLTARIDVEDGVYNGIISAGTFTHGHVGSDVFEELLRVAASGALFVLSINAEHYASQGFERKLGALSAQVKGLNRAETPIYDGVRDNEHAGDMALIVSFRKA
ncbi:MAG: methyltransferase domain-containing protein [Litoreibacter sp.]|nr:methyltransferase domain-containing protein [Litoreibacter sp.]